MKMSDWDKAVMTSIDARVPYYEHPLGGCRDYECCVSGPEEYRCGFSFEECKEDLELWLKSRLKELEKCGTIEDLNDVSMYGILIQSDKVTYEYPGEIKGTSS